MSSAPVPSFPIRTDNPAHVAFLEAVLGECTKKGDFAEATHFIAFVIPFVLPANCPLPQLNRLRDRRMANSAEQHELVYPTALNADDSVAAWKQRLLFSLGDFNRDRDVARHAGRTVIFVHKLVPGLWDGLFLSTTQTFIPLQQAAKPSYKFIGLPTAIHDTNVMKQQRRLFAELARGGNSVVHEHCLCRRKEQLSSALAQLTYTTFLIISGHGSENGTTVAISDGIGGIEQLDYSYFADQFRVVCQQSPQFRAVIFLSCNIGADGGLAEQLAKRCPVTTLSFACGVWGYQTLLDQTKEYIQILLRLWLGYYAAEKESVDFMKQRAYLGPVEVGVVPRLSVVAWSIYNKQRGLPDTIQSLHLNPVLCRPRLRNSRGYHDPKWWSVQRLKDWWTAEPEVLNNICATGSIATAFYDIRFADLPGRQAGLPMVMASPEADRCTDMEIERLETGS